MNEAINLGEAQVSSVNGPDHAPKHTPPPISGYRTLSDAEVNQINALKSLGQDLGDAIDDVLALIEERTRVYGTPDGEHKRWVAVGKTHLQQGLMALARAVAAPTNF